MDYVIHRLFVKSLCLIREYKYKWFENNFQVDESDYESVTAHKIALLRKEQEKARWLNSPNAYQRIEILETGTDNPKKITKVFQN